MSNIATEHKGLAAVYRACTEMDAIWRPTTANDLGIDGQIEFLRVGSPVATGHVLAVQVKSGESYFADDAGPVVVYPNERQRAYWSRLSLPIVLIAHNPKSDVTLYADVKTQLGGDGAIRVAKDAKFVPEARDHLVEIAEAHSGAVDPADITDRLRAARLEVGGGRAITGVEFLLASINLEGGYFELRMARLHTLLKLAVGDYGISLGQREYDWIHRCTILCWSLRLVERFEGDFDYWWYEQQMVPDTAVALLGLGRAVVEFVFDNAADFVAWGTLGSSDPDDAVDVARELMAMCQESSDHVDASDRPFDEHWM